MSGESRKINKQCEMEKNGEQKKKGVFLTLTPRVTPKLHKLPNATVDDVQNHCSNFIRQCGSKATLYRSSNEFYSKANFILSEGSSYHNKNTCQGLKRTIMAVPLSQVGGLRSCSRCGGSH